MLNGGRNIEVENNNSKPNRIEGEIYGLKGAGALLRLRGTNFEALVLVLKIGLGG